MLKIAIDFDGVIADTVETAIAIYNEKYFSNMTIDHITKYNLFECLDKVVADELLKIIASAECTNRLRPVKGAAELITWMRSKGWNVCVATSTWPENFGRKYEWIKRFMPCLDGCDIICIKHKEWMKTDVLIEDCQENLAAMGPGTTRILIDKPYNRDERADFVYSINRVAGWNEIKNILDKEDLEYGE